MNTNQQTKLVVGLIFSGIAGAVAFYLTHQSPRPIPLLNRVGKKISDVGEMIENMDFDCEHIAENIQQRLPSKASILSNAADLLATGLKIWKKFT